MFQNSLIHLVGAILVVARSVAITFLTAVMALLVVVGMAEAAEFNVNSESDAVDANTGGVFDGICETSVGNGVCTLRAAIQEANSNGADDIIHIPAGTFSVNGTSGEDLGVDGDLDLTTNISLIGSGARDTILRGGGNDRVIHINGATEVLIQGVTITGGVITDDHGGGILNVNAKLTIESSSISGNETVTTIIGTDGGGIRNNGGVLIITNSTISNNRASPISNGHGGGIFNQGGPLTITNSTISGNISNLDGGGIMNAVADQVTISNSTISFNQVTDVNANDAGGGIRDFGGLILKNTIITNNSGPPDTPNCAGNVTLQGGNLIENGEGCTFTNQSATDQIGTADAPIDPKIDSTLKDNGGPTDTHSLLAGSPAIDAGDDANCSDTDQRGVDRPQGDACDIGAFELAPTDDANGNGIPDNLENNGSNNGENATGGGGCAISSTNVGQGFYSAMMILCLVGATLAVARFHKARASDHPAKAGQA